MEKRKTVDYYNAHSSEYFNNSVNIDMKSLCDTFLKYVPINGRILDLGCGSGRDLKYFKDKGYECEGLDISKELCILASNYSGCVVHCQDVLDWNPEYKYDGIWACASLLHLTKEELFQFFSNLDKYLNPGGIIFCSMKTGIATGYDSKGRFFTDFSEELLNELIKETNITILDTFYSTDNMNRNVRWMNVIIKNGE